MAASAFGSYNPSTNAPAGSQLQSLALARGLTNIQSLSELGQLQAIAANLMDTPYSTVPGTLLSLQKGTKKVTGIVENTATAILTITVPNVLASALIRVDLVGIAGASGAIGAGECVTAVSYNFSVARTPGVAMGAKMSTAFGSAAAVVVGAGTMTCVSADPTLTGEGVTVTNTGIIKVTIDASATADAHVCLVSWEILNSLAGGVTVA